MIILPKEQLSEVMCKHAEKENGVNDLLEIMLESLMVAERGELPVIVLMDKTAMDKESYQRVIPRMREERVLFPNG